LVKKTKIKIQNKYVFRTTISEFLYIFLKKRMDLAWLPSPSAWVMPERGASLAWLLDPRHLGLTCSGKIIVD